MPKTIYLDNQSTTPTDPRVCAAMLAQLAVDNVGNPHSEHIAGHRAAAVVEAAREQVAKLIGATPEEIIFTSGATEANNIALQGVARSRAKRGDHFVTVATEHKCVLETMSYLKRQGFSVDVLPVGRNGIVDLKQVGEAISDDTCAVSVMTANNEIGVLQPVAEIAELCHNKGIIFHTDAAQAVGKMPIDVGALGIDLMSVSGHKLYAPIGIGALYVSAELELELIPITQGGRQERGLRPGTVPPYLCAAFGEACVIAGQEMNADADKAKTLREEFLSSLRQAVPDVRINGDMQRRLESNLSLTFSGVDADHLIGALQPTLAISTGSACNGGALQPSHVLLSLGLSEAEANSTVRIGFGRFNDTTEVREAATQLARAVNELRGGKSVHQSAA